MGPRGYIEKAFEALKNIFKRHIEKWRSKDLESALRILFRRFNHGDFGHFGEWYTCRTLIKNGYLILERNWRAPFGEIDIIAFKERKLFAFEVKTRSKKSADFASPFHAINREKRNRISKLLTFYQRGKLHTYHLPRMRGVTFYGVSVVVEYKKNVPWPRVETEFRELKL